MSFAQEVSPWQMTAALWSEHIPESDTEQLSIPVSFPTQPTPYSTAESMSSPNTPLDTAIAPNSHIHQPDMQYRFTATN